MGGRRRMKLMMLVLAILLGVAVYLRLWTIDYTISSDEAQLLRRQFDLANREAIDESAEWRFRYDREATKAAKCAKELMQIKGSTGSGGAPSIFQRLGALEKENSALHKLVEALKRELEAQKLKCQS